MRPIIVTDSNCDLSEDIISKYNIQVLSFKFTLGNDSYTDNLGKAISHKEFYRRLGNGEKASTSQITPYEFEQIFSNLVSLGYDVIYVGFSSALSQTFSNALIAAENTRGKNRDSKICTIDTKNATSGQALLVYGAALMASEGKSYESITNWLLDNVPRTGTYFIVNELEYLFRGGRLSSASAVVGSMLNIKPMLKICDKGKLVLNKKVRGRRRALGLMLDEVILNIKTDHEGRVFINHGECYDDALDFAKLLKKEVEDIEVIINHIGPVIGAHTGAGVISVSFTRHFD